MTPAELCQLAGLTEEAEQAAQPGMPLRTFVEQLVRVGQVRAAINGLSQVLPRADAIAWALASIRSVDAVMKKPNAEPTVALIEQWLKEPSEDLRRATRDAADRAGIATPAGCLGMAVFFSGGSMAPAEAPVSPEPAQNVCGKTVAGAIALAVALDPVRAPELLRGFFDHGMRISNQLKIWEKHQENKEKEDRERKTEV